MAFVEGGIANQDTGIESSEILSKAAVFVVRMAAA